MEDPQKTDKYQHMNQLLKSFYPFRNGFYKLHEFCSCHSSLLVILHNASTTREISIFVWV